MNDHFVDYFPIKNQAACKLKWSWSTLWLYTGKTASCHRVKKHDFDLDTFNFHNTDQKLNHRDKMLSGVWPGNGCEYCENIEKNNGTSDRLLHNNIPGFPVELLTDSNEKKVTPTILEVYFDNKCNLSCVYCVPQLSSRIQNEIKKFGTGNFDFNRSKNLTDKEVFPLYEKTNNFQKIKNNFWKWMEENSINLQRFHMLGGEPFYQEDFVNLVKFFENNPNKDLEFNIISNISIPPKKFKKYIDLLKTLVEENKVKRIDLTVSIDCWGKKQEYTRHGLNLNWFEENINYLIEQDDWLRLNINQTVSVLTIVGMDKLYKKIISWRKKKNISIYYGLVVGWDFLHPTIFKYSVWKDTFDKLFLLNKESTISTFDKQNEINSLNGIVKMLKKVKTDNVNEITKMKKYLDEIDKRRNLNWKDTFPHLVK